MRDRTHLIRMMHTADDAAELLQRYGWIRGTRGNPNIGFCLVGALGAARAPLDLDDYVAKAANIAIGDLQNLMRWNDNPKRTKDDVLRALDRAARDIEDELRREHGMTQNEIRRLRRRDDDQRSVAS